MVNDISHYHLRLGTTVNGQALDIPVYRVKGQSPGPKVYIQANVHGAEVQGNAEIQRLLKVFEQQPIRGEILLVPFANPIGANLKMGDYTFGRVDPQNGQNWNRHYFFCAESLQDFIRDIKPEQTLANIKQAFRERWQALILARLNQPWGVSLATRLNLILQLEALDADIVLDLHTGPNSIPHLYAPTYARASARHFNIDAVLLIPHHFDGALDEATFAPWCEIQEALEQQRKQQIDVNVEAYTLELGSQEEVRFDDIQADPYGIQSYLAYKEVLLDYRPAAVQDKPTAKACWLKDYRTFFAKEGGLVEFNAAPGAELKQGELVATQMTGDLIAARKKITAPQDMRLIHHYPSASVTTASQLFKAMTQQFDL